MLVSKLFLFFFILQKDRSEGMSSALDSLEQQDTWEEFLSYKLSNRYISKKEKEQFTSFVSEKRYSKVASAIRKNGEASMQ